MGVFDQFATKAAFIDAWRKIQKKRKAGGIDQISVEFYEKDFDRRLDNLLKRVRTGTYAPEPYQRIEVKKENAPGESRPLSLPTINDKIVQEALRACLEPIYKSIFLDVSYAYRPGKGAAKAIRRISHIIASQPVAWAAGADIDAFFDKMDHAILIKELRKQVDEPKIIKLVRMWMENGVITSDSRYHDTNAGVAQGGIISPLLSNIYLHPFDAYLVERKANYVRYADNFVLLSESRKKIEETFDAACTMLAENLKLSLNYRPAYFHKLSNGFVFMGIFFKDKRRFIDRARIQKAKDQIANLADRLFLNNTDMFHQKLEEKVVGFENYYGDLVETDRLYGQLNEHLEKKLTDLLTRQAKNSGQRPVKTHIRSMLAPIRLYGITSHDRAQKEWVDDLTEQCVTLFDQWQRHQSGQTDDRQNYGGKQAGLKTGSDPEKQAGQAVRRQKNKYRKIENTSREVVVQYFGAFIGKTKNRIVVKQKGVKVMEVC